MRVTLKKKTTTVNVKIGIAWTFWISLFIPGIAVLSFLRRRLYWQAIIVIAYLVIQNMFLPGHPMKVVVFGSYPDASSYADVETYKKAFYIWVVFRLFIGAYAIRGNKLTGHELFWRGYVCPIESEAVLAETHWSLSRIDPHTMQSKMEARHKAGLNDVSVEMRHKPAQLTSGGLFDASVPNASTQPSMSPEERARVLITQDTGLFDPVATLLFFGVAVVGAAAVISYQLYIARPETPKGTSLAQSTVSLSQETSAPADSLTTNDDPYLPMSPFSLGKHRLNLIVRPGTGGQDTLNLTLEGSQSSLNVPIPFGGFEKIEVARRGVNDQGVEWILFHLSEGSEVCPANYILMAADANAKVGQVAVSEVPTLCSVDRDQIGETASGMSIVIRTPGRSYTLSLYGRTLNSNGHIVTFR